MHTFAAAQEELAKAVSKSQVQLGLGNLQAIALTSERIPVCTVFQSFLLTTCKSSKQKSGKRGLLILVRSF